MVDKGFDQRRFSPKGLASKTINIFRRGKESLEASINKQPLSVSRDAAGEIYRIESNGVILDLRKAGEGCDTWVDKDDKSGQILHIPPGMLIAKADFTPLGISRVEKNQSKVTITLSKGIQGLKDIFSEFDRLSQGREVVLMPEYIFGFTNPVMARFLKRFGFLWGEQERIDLDDPNSEVGQWVIGKTAEVRQKFTEIASDESRIQKLEQRAQAHREKLLK